MDIGLHTVHRTPEKGVSETGLDASVSLILETVWRGAGANRAAIVRHTEIETDPIGQKHSQESQVPMPVSWSWGCITHFPLSISGFHHPVLVNTLCLKPGPKPLFKNIEGVFCQESERASVWRDLTWFGNGERMVDEDVSGCEDVRSAAGHLPPDLCEAVVKRLSSADAGWDWQHEEILTTPTDIQVRQQFHMAPVRYEMPLILVRSRQSGGVITMEMVFS
ncbi:hypothetical protein Bbelb_411590 [Branchiostoma belcheri]|nr:hypothetical protein Bbelb_411590 [Branchiostoma belcheri]